MTYSDTRKPSRVSIYEGQQVYAREAWVKTVHKWEDQNNIMSSAVTEVITKERSGIGEQRAQEKNVRYHAFVLVRRQGYKGHPHF